METSSKMTDSLEESDKDEIINDHIDRSFLSAELEALNSIYIDEIDVNKEDEIFTSVSIDLHPATADNVDQQYVKMTLKLILSEEYPDDLPRITIRNPRGLSDEKLKSIIEELSIIAEEKKGNSMLFEIIEAAKEHLTSQNRPSGECAICLYGFSEHDIFTRTECYHYFHSHCLARYVTNILKNEESEDKDKAKSSELFCPMCRIPIQFSAIDEQYPPPTAINEEMFNLTDEITDLQKKMADLYQKQLEKGGIIDVEAEKNKYLLEISNVPSQSTLAEKPSSKVVEHSPIDEIINAESDAVQSHKDKTKSSGKSAKLSSRGYNHGYIDKRRRFDSKYERRPENYRQSNYGKYQQNREGQFRKASSQIASQKYSKKETLQIDPEDQQACEESTSEVTEPLNKNSDSPDSVKPKYSNQSEGKFNYNRNPRFNQRGRGHRYSNYSNNSSDYSFNRDRRYNDSNNYYKFNYHNRKQSQNNDHFEDKFQDDLDQRDRGRNFKDKNINFEDKSQDDLDQRHRGRNFKDKNTNFEDKFQDDLDQRHRSSRNFKDKNTNFEDKFQDDLDQRHRGSRNFKDKNTNFEDKFQDDLDQRHRGRNFKEKDITFDHKAQHKNEKANDSARKFSEKFSSNDTQYHDKYDYNRSSRYQRNPNKSYNHGQYSSQNGSYKNYGSEKWKNQSYQKKMSEDFKQEAVAKESESQLKGRPVAEQNVESSVAQSKGLEKSSISDIIPGGSPSMLRPPPGFANPASRVHYGLQAANPPPGFSKS